MVGIFPHLFFVLMFFLFNFAPMFRKCYNILARILGESKNGCYEPGVEQYQFNCPCCADNNGGVEDDKFNLEVNLGKLKYHCWKCGDTDGTKGNLKNLIKKYGRARDLKDFSEELSYLVKSKMYDINLYRVNKMDENGENEFLKLPETFTKIDIRTLKNKKLCEYLHKRRITQDIIDKFRIGYTTWDEKSYSMRNRLIIPSYDEFGLLNYWVGRDFSDYKNAFKYKNCTANKNDIIFQESKINWDFDVVLCEGAIDCLYLPNAISMLGKVLTETSALYKKLMSKCNGNVIIVLDSDTELFETVSIYNKLNIGRLENKVWFTKPERYKDIGEIYENEGKKGIIKLLRDKRKFSEFKTLNFSTKW